MNKINLRNVYSVKFFQEDYGYYYKLIETDKDLIYMLDCLNYNDLGWLRKAVGKYDTIVDIELLAVVSNDTITRI